MIDLLCAFVFVLAMLFLFLVGVGACEVSPYDFRREK
jgi:hypothetical protein